MFNLYKSRNTKFIMELESHRSVSIPKEERAYRERHRADFPDPEYDREVPSHVVYHCANKKAQCTYSRSCFNTRSSELFLGAKDVIDVEAFHYTDASNTPYLPSLTKADEERTQNEPPHTHHLRLVHDLWEPSYGADYVQGATCSTHGDVSTQERVVGEGEQLQHIDRQEPDGSYDIKDCGIEGSVSPSREEIACSSDNESDSSAEEAHPVHGLPAGTQVEGRILALYID